MVKIPPPLTEGIYYNLETLKGIEPRLMLFPMERGEGETA